jgi:hypothetical protein
MEEKEMDGKVIISLDDYNGLQAELRLTQSLAERLLNEQKEPIFSVETGYSGYNLILTEKGKRQYLKDCVEANPQLVFKNGFENKVLEWDIAKKPEGDSNA